MMKSTHLEIGHSNPKKELMLDSIVLPHLKIDNESSKPSISKIKKPK